MPTFIFAYHGGNAPSDPAEAERLMGLWNDWYGEMGDRLIDDGGPCGKSWTVSASGATEGGEANPLAGYTVVEVADQNEANELAKGCPLVQDGSGSVEVCEIHEI